VASSLLLGTAPLVGGLLLGAGGVLAGWAGWKFGLARRPQPAMIPVAVVEPRRRPSTRR
jgi:hypothetical protein